MSDRDFADLMREKFSGGVISQEAMLKQLEAREKELRAKLQMISMVPPSAPPYAVLPTPKLGGNSFTLGNCAHCGDAVSMFSSHPHVTDSDERLFCDIQCQMNRRVQEGLELEAGIEYVKRSLGVEE